MVRCSSSLHPLAQGEGGGGGDSNGDCWYCLFCLCVDDPISQIRYTRVSVLLLFFWPSKDNQMSISNWASSPASNEEKEKLGTKRKSKTILTNIPSAQESKKNPNCPTLCSLETTILLCLGWSFQSGGQQKGGSHITHRQEQLRENFPGFTLLCPRLTKQELLENSWPFIKLAHSSGSSELLALLGMTLCPSKTPLEFEKVESWLTYKGHGVQPKVCFRSWPFPQTWTGLTINAKRVCECAGRGRGLCLLKEAVLKMGWKTILLFPIP